MSKVSLACAACSKSIKAVSTKMSLTVCESCGVLYCGNCSTQQNGSNCVTSKHGWEHLSKIQSIPLSKSSYYDPVRTVFKGHDVVLTLSSEVIKAERSITFHLFWSSKSFDIAFSSIRETVGFNEKVKNQYEWYSKLSEIHPVSYSTPSTYDPTLKGRVPPTRPTRSQYVNRRDQFCRKSSVQIYNCECNGGERTCPNCTGETVVSCPDCWSRRSGKCSNCAGTGTVTDPKCRGSGYHSRCGGTGRLTCGTCSGSGSVRVSDVETKRCGSCGGDGRDSYGYYCSRCGGSGVVSQRVYYNVTCPNCGGSGEVRCGGCFGTGTCPYCNGTGKIPDSVCGGTGICQTCYGRGVLRCPTCSGEGIVVCPICEGSSALVGFTSDVYTYEVITDSKTILDPYFEREDKEKLQRVISDVSSGYLMLPNLKGTTLEKHVGIINDLMDEERKKAIQANVELHNMARDREFQSSTEADQILQQSLLDDIESGLRSSWRSTTSDSYYSSFKLSLSSSERRRETSKYYGERLFYSDLHYCFPITSTTFSREDKIESEKPVVCIGTHGEFEFIPPKKFIEIKKVLSFTLLLLSGIMAIYLYSNNTFFIVDLSRFVDYSVAINYKGMILIALFSLSLFIFFAWWTYSQWYESIIVILGNDETAKLRFMYLLGEYILQNEGYIHDQIFNEVKENSMAVRNVYGSSQSFRAVFGKRKIKVININRSSVLNSIPQVDTILGYADHVFVIVNAYLNDYEEEIYSLKELIDGKPQKWIVTPYVKDLLVEGVENPIFFSLHNLSDILVGKGEKEKQMKTIGKMIGMEVEQDV